MINDLEPYQCLEENCWQSHKTYRSLHQLRMHYKVCHLTAALLSDLATTYQCVFCTEAIAGKIRDRFKHVGRHMEDIVFSAIPKQYEEWEFYSETCSLESQQNDASRGAYEDIRMG